MGRWLTVLVSAVVASGCGGGGAGSTATRLDSAGVHIVSNTGPDRSLTAALHLAYRLGGKPSGAESFYELFHGQVGVSSAGVIGVVDWHQRQVSAYTPDGALISVYGRGGGGPGEFKYPSSVAVTPAGEVLVYDFGKRALVPFAADGTPLDERRLTVPFNGAVMVATPDGLVLRSEIRQSREGKTTSRILYLTPSDTAQLGPSTTSAYKSVVYKSCAVSMSQPPLFSPELVWASNGVRTAVVGGPDYSIRIFDDTTLVDVVRRDIPAEKATEEVAKREVGEGEVWYVGPRRCVVPAAEVIEQRGYEPVVPVVEAVAVTPTGGLWVERRNPGTKARSVDVFDRDGSYLGTLTPPPPFPEAFLPDGRIVTIEKDSLDVQTVGVYTVAVEGS